MKTGQGRHQTMSWCGGFGLAFTLACLATHDVHAAVSFANGDASVAGKLVYRTNLLASASAPWPPVLEPGGGVIPPNSAQDSAFPLQSTDPNPFNEDVSAQVAFAADCFSPATGQREQRLASAKADASHESTFDDTVLTASGVAETDVTNYGGIDTCGTGQATARAVGNYLIYSDEPYAVSLSGRLIGEGVVWLFDISAGTLLWEHRSEGPFSFSSMALPAGTVLDLFAQASRGDAITVPWDDVVRQQDRSVSDHSSFDIVLEVTPPSGAEDLLVRCLHEPLYPQAGEPVWIRAEALDADGNAVQAEAIEVYFNDRSQPYQRTDGPAALQETFVADGGTQFFYGCQATRGDRRAFSGFRRVDVGAREVQERVAVPVFYSGRTSHKIDLVFFAEEDSYPDGPTGDAFRQDIYQVVRDGLFEIPWFVRNQEELNIWIAMDPAGVEPKDPNDPTKKCKKDKPPGFARNYSFADAAGIIHKEACRDNAALKTFTTDFDPQNLQVVAHEIGHAAFSLSDEYEGANTLYFTLPDFPNLLTSGISCRDAAERRGKDPTACRFLDEARGWFINGARWIFEPRFRDQGQPWSGRGDLMQQTGRGRCLFTTGDRCARYRVGDSEIDRMNWKVGKCRAGDC